MNILYIGPLALGGTCLQRLWALQDLGYSVVGLDTGVYSKVPAIQFFNKVRRKFFPKYVDFCLNRQIVAMSGMIQPDVVWIDKGLFVKPEVLIELKMLRSNPVIISFSPDDMMNPNNQTPDYLKCISLYDYHITTKSYNVKELKGLGAVRVMFINNSYCRRSHHPIYLSISQRNQMGGSVGFIGFWERDRAKRIEFLASNGVDIRVWGPWKSSRNYPANMRIEGRVAWGDDYAKVISAFDINLCFLRKENRDRQTTRSIEIPACGGFLLAERTDEHLSLFNEGEEAEFFDSDSELYDKVSYYLNNEGERKRIAYSGYRRCVTNGYSYTYRLKNVMDAVINRKDGLL